MARMVRQPLPDPGPVYDQAYIAQLADAINRYMFQSTAPGEMIAARFIGVGTPQVGGTLGLPDTTSLATGTYYLAQVPGAPAGTFFLTMVAPSDP